MAWFAIGFLITANIGLFIWCIALQKMIQQTHGVIDAKQMAEVDAMIQGPMWNDHNATLILNHDKRIGVVEAKVAKIVFVADNQVSWNDDEKKMN